MKATTDLDIPRLVQEFLSELMQACTPDLPETDRDRYEVEYSESYQFDQIDRMLQLQQFDHTIEDYASNAISETGFALDDLPTLQQRQLMDGVARAVREAIYYQEHIRTQPFSTYAYMDPDLAPAPLKLVATTGQGIVHQTNTRPLADYIEKYLTSDAHNWTEATRKEKRVPLAWFSEVVGGTTDIRSITADNILDYRNAMLKLRKHVPAGTPLSKAQTDTPSKRVHAKTARKKFDTVMTFMRWLNDLGVIETVPAGGLSVKVPKTPKLQQRRPFEPAELDQLFTSPQYAGCKSPSRRSKPGDMVIMDDEYWIPLLLMYTGMRISEPLQLGATDVILDQPHPHIRLDSAKHQLKSAAAERIVPIHPDLETFGFIDFVKDRQQKTPKQKLFRNIKSKSNIGSYYSKKLGRYLTAIGLSDPRLVAHSFRHGFKTALRNAAVPEGEQHFLMGHSDSSTAHGYGVASDIKVLHNWVSKLDFELSEQTRELLHSNRNKTSLH